MHLYDFKVLKRTVERLLESLIHGIFQNYLRPSRTYLENSAHPSNGVEERYPGLLGTLNLQRDQLDDALLEQEICDAKQKLRTICSPRGIPNGVVVLNTTSN